MSTTDQLPEPELGYIKTDKSNQPAFSARQMWEAMGHATQPAQATQAEVTDDRLLEIGREWTKEVGWYEFEVNDFIGCARAILALRPVQVPMTPASREVIMATRTANADADEWPEPWAYRRGWNDAEAHHGITAQAKKEDE